LEIAVRNGTPRAKDRFKLHTVWHQGIVGGIDLRNADIPPRDPCLVYSKQIRANPLAVCGTSART
jgi:hypothetical protein